MSDTNTNPTDTPAPAVTNPPSATPLTDGIKKALTDRDEQIADLKAKLDAAAQNGKNLNAQIEVLNGTIDHLHAQLADYASAEALLNVG